MAVRTPATLVLMRAKVTFSLHSYDHDPRVAHYGQEAAAALGVPAERVFKTLLVSVQGLRAPAGVGIVAVCNQLYLKATARALGGKRADLALPNVAERLTGYVVGGISPIGQKRSLPTVLDDSALDYDTIFCSGGRRGLEIELSPHDLARLTGAVLATVHH